MRWGEATALRARRVDLLRGRIEVAEAVAEVNGRLVYGDTKTHRSRTVALPRFLRDLLAEALPADGDGLLFTAPGGGPLRHTNYRRRVWHPALAATGLPLDLRIHDLRHTCAALLIAQGAHPEAIRRHLGHSSIAVTHDNYGHLFPDEQGRLAAALDRTFDEARTDLPRPEHGLGVVQLRHTQ